MKWSLQIGRIAGTAVHVHLTFVILLLWVWFAHYQIGGASAAWAGLTFVIAVFGCVLLHEFGHVAMAGHFGIKTPQITLFPIGGIATIEQIPDKPRQEIFIALAGPLVNLAITALILLILGQMVGVDQAFDIQDPHISFLTRLAGVNIFLMLFNLIPAFPMDGGRVLRAILALWMPGVRATQIAARIGQSVALAFGVIGLFYNPWLIIIAIFIYLAAIGEEQDAELRDIAQNVRVCDVMITEFETLAHSASVEAAVDKLLATTQSNFPVVGMDGRLMGLVTRHAIINALKDLGPQTPLAQTVLTDIPQISDSLPLAEGLRRMRETKAPVIWAVDDKGALRGMITYETLGELLAVRELTNRDFKFGRLRNKKLQHRF